MPTIQPVHVVAIQPTKEQPMASANIQLPNIKSASFWSSLAGIASILCGTLNVGSNLTASIQNVLVAIGGLLVAIPAHHIIQSQVASKPSA